MPECVFDASFIGKANGLLTGERIGNLLNRRLTAMRSVTTGQSSVRYNGKLLSEYIAIVKEHRNDVVEQFFELLDKGPNIRTKSTLSRTDKAKANECRWPTHDQHVLAAAIGGVEVTIHVTENTLGCCAPKVKRIFDIRINHVV
jgi:hypothetical protein